MRTTFRLGLCLLISGCSVNQAPVPPVDPEIFEIISLCSAGASAKMGFDISLAAKRNLEKTGYEGSLSAALAQEVAGMIMKVNVGDTARVDLYREYQKCLADRRPH